MDQSPPAWAGNFDCTAGTCRRKRLMAAAFSKKALERYRKDPRFQLKCLECTSAQEVLEQQQAAARREKNESTREALDGKDSECRACAKCHHELLASAFNRNQWSKGVGKSKCVACVEQSMKEEQANRQLAQQSTLHDARHALAAAEATGDSLKIVRAAAQLSALEAEQVTGVKTTKLRPAHQRRGPGPRRA